MSGINDFRMELNVLLETGFDREDTKKGYKTMDNRTILRRSDEVWIQNLYRSVINSLVNPIHVSGVLTADHADDADFYRTHGRFNHE